MMPPLDPPDPDPDFCEECGAPYEWDSDGESVYRLPHECPCETCMDQTVVHCACYFDGETDPDCPCKGTGEVPCPACGEWPEGEPED